MFQETLKELFPSWEAVSERYREVIIFTVGLMKDPRPLVDHIYEMQIEDYLNTMRHGVYRPSLDVVLFKSFYTEATVELLDHPLHNKYFNYYDHGKDDSYNRPSDITPIFIPSSLYDFGWVTEEIILGDIKNQVTEIPECAMEIHYPDETVATSLLHMCRTISEHQPVTDLSVSYAHCNGSTAVEGLKLSKSTQSIYLDECTLPKSFMRDIFQQLHDCVTLRLLQLRLINLREVEEDLDKLLDNLVSNHMNGLSQTKLHLRISGHKFSREFREKWNEHCKEIPSIDCNISY